MLRGFLGLLALVLLTPAPALAAWHQAKTRHFIIYSEQTPQEVTEFATRLEKFDRAVRYARSMADPPLGDASKLTVYVLRDQDAVARMAGAPDSGIAGYYVASISGPRAFVYRKVREERDFAITPEVIFFHEYFHHLMLGYTDAALPHWVVEGFAEFFSTAKIEDDGSVMLGRPADHRALGLFLLSDLSLKQMLGNSYKELSGREVIMLYTRGWLLTHYLAFEPSRQGQLERYLQLIQQGRPHLEAAQVAFGDFRQLSRELDQYVKRKTLPGLRVAADKLTVGPISVRRLGDAEAAAMNIKMRLDRRSKLNRGDAANISENARSVGRRFPNDALVQSILATAELAAGDYGAAIAAADRALAINPNELRALIAKARAQMKLAAAAPQTADWDGIRALLLRANRADTENAEPLMLYYQTFTAAGAAPTENAKAALAYARVLMPQDDELRMIAARQLVNDAKLADAAKTLSPIAYDPHDKQRDLAMKALTAISSGDRKAALAAIDELYAKKTKDDRTVRNRERGLKR